MGDVVSGGGGEARDRAGACEQVRFYHMCFLSTLCGWLIGLNLIDGCGERHQNSRVRPGRKGYDTSLSGTFIIFFGGLTSINACCHFYNAKGCLALHRLYGYEGTAIP